jgi:hypothetical protein
LQRELSGSLEVHAVGQSGRRVLVAENPTKPYLPGQPRIRLPTGTTVASIQVQQSLLEYLKGAHLTTELDDILPFMKYIFVSTYLPLDSGTVRVIGKQLTDSRCLNRYKPHHTGISCLFTIKRHAVVKSW